MMLEVFPRKKNSENLGRDVFKFDEYRTSPPEFSPSHYATKVPKVQTRENLALI